MVPPGKESRRVSVLAPGLSWIDLEFLGRPHAIAAALVQSRGSVAIVDPGPASCLPALERGLAGRGLRLADVTHLLITHIHLDHAGAAGTIAAAVPGLRVVVHERGARHLADPSKLVGSASRLYGAAMNRLWGDIRPVPAPALVSVGGGERIEAGGRTFEVAYTPGHASHHVSYFDAASRVAFVGDTAGVCIDGGAVLPPTPPPDIDLEAWRESARRIEAWAPHTLFMTHFGPVTAVRPHLQALFARLDQMATWVQQTLDEPGSDEQRSERFAARVHQDLRREMSDTQLAAYTVAAPFEHLWGGLARYWRKRQARSGP
jgi:glyoxylase-like metal-dependent hydrolase (beta-lactamase superfamily II)